MVANALARSFRTLRSALSRVLAADGTTVTTRDLEESQTSQLTQLHRELAGHPARGLTPSKLQSILEAAEQGDVLAQFELFADMEERDGHIDSEFGKRRRALLGLPWDIVPPPNATAQEKKAAAAVKEAVESLGFETLVFELADAIGKGFACLEFDGWHRVENVMVPKHIDFRPQTWFQLPQGPREEIRLRDNSADGMALQPLGWIVHKHKARSGFLARASMFRSLVWPYLFKNYSVGDLAEFLEIYGIPLRIGKYPPGASEKDKTTLLRALASIGHNAAGIIPDGMMLEFKDAAAGDPDAFIAMIDWCERTQSKVILGGTLTSQADRGSNTNALGNVHNEVRKDLRDSDARQIEGTLTRDLIYPIAVLNGWVDGPSRSPRLRLQTEEPEDIEKFSRGLGSLVSMGMRISRQWAQQRVAIPEPEGDEDVLTSPGRPPFAAASLGRAVASAQVTGATIQELVAQRMQVEAADPHQALINRIRDLVSEATDLADLRERLLNAFGDLPREDLARVMEAGFAVADLIGRRDANDESV